MPFLSNSMRVGPGHGAGDGGREDCFEGGDARLANTVWMTGRESPMRRPEIFTNHGSCPPGPWRMGKT